MNIKTKLILGIGMLAGMIILLVTLSVVNLQILTATEPDSPAAMPGLERALLWISITGSICILTGLVLLYWLPRSISKPIKELKEGILEIADHNYEKRLNMDKNEEFREVADSFNRMAERLTEYRASTLSDILSAKKFIEAIVNSIDDPVIGLNMDRQILFINEEALNVLNLKRENVIRKSAEELALKNDLLRRLIRELVTPSEQKEPLKIYADNKAFSLKLPDKILSNGAAIRADVGTSIDGRQISFTTDINGKKGPNRFGHDLFVFRVQDASDKLVGAKKIKDYTEDELGDLSSGGINNLMGKPCSKNSKQTANGIGCAWYAINDVCPDDASKGYWECLPK